MQYIKSQVREGTKGSGSCGLW